MMKRKKTPTAGGKKADTKSAPQPADPLLLPDDTPCIDGHHPDGTPWRKMTADIPANYVPVEPFSNEEIKLVRMVYGPAGRRERFLRKRLHAMKSVIPPTVPAAATDAPAKPDESAETVDHKGAATVECKRKRVKVNDRMAAELLKNPDSRDWSAQQWADRLGCSKSTVSVTPQFKALLAMRVGAQIERQVKKAKMRK